MTRPDRAAAALGLPPGADADAARAAFLRRLAAEDFAPPEATVAAANALTGADLPLTPDAVAAEAEAFRGEVETFAADYWSLPPADRRARWADLSVRCRDGQTAAYLRHLEGGLGVEAVPQSDPAAEELAGLVRELFLLRPRPRAVRRAEWLAARSANEASWADAVRRLRTEAPAIVSLDPSLIDRLEPATWTPAAVPADAWRPSEPVSDEGMHRAIDEFRQRRAASEQAAGRRRREGPKLTPGWSGAAVALLFIIVRCAGLSSSSREASSPARPDAPVYRQPATPQAPPPGYDDLTFTRQELESFLRYDPKSGEPAPPRYSEWLLRVRSVTPGSDPRRRSDLLQKFSKTAPTSRR